MKKLCCLILSLGLVLGLTACAAQAERKGDPVLVYGSGDYTAINPALYEHGEINSLLFSGLTAHDADNKVVPGLAERWEYDEAGRTYTFYLRKGVKWHDGEPFTSADVRFTLEAILDPDNASEIASNYAEIEEIATPDDYTVSLRLKTPDVAMLDYLTVGVLPRHLLMGKDLTTDEFNRKPVGTGPYRLADWDRGQSIVLEKNPDYYGGEPKISSVVFKIVPDEQARAVQLRSGELDFAQVSPRDGESFRSDAKYAVYDRKTADYRGILYNFAHPLFKNHRELPNALSYAIDRQALVDSVLLGMGEPAYSPLQAGPYANPDMERYDYAPEKTEALLAKAGWSKAADGVYQKDGERLSFAIHCAEGDQVRVDMAAVCAQQLKAVGAEVSVRVDAEIDWAGQEAYLIGWGSPFDPDDHTYKVFVSGQAANYGSYENAQVDSLLKRARETDVEVDRMNYYKAFQEELAKDLPFTFLAYTDAVYVAGRKIEGITGQTVLAHHGVGIFWNVWEWTLPE